MELVAAPTLSGCPPARGPQLGRHLSISPVLLVRLHRQDEALRRHGKELGLEQEPGIQAIGYILRPDSEGSVTITSSDPTAPLDIDPNFFATQHDRDTGVARPVRPGDIAVLFRTRDSHREFEAALGDAGLRDVEIREYRAVLRQTFGVDLPAGCRDPIAPPAAAGPAGPESFLTDMRL